MTTNENSLIIIISTIIFTAIGTFVGSYFLNKVERNKDSKSLKQYLIDKISISLERLNILLSNLGNDPIQYGYFSLQTISSIKVILSELQSVTKDKIFLLRSRDLNHNVINAIDEISSVITEIETMEYGPVNNHTEHSHILNKAQGEFRALKLQLFKMGFSINENLEPQYIEIPSDKEQKHQDDMIKEIKSLIEILNNNIKSSEFNLEKDNSKAQKQRAFFAVKLLNVQSKTKDLLEKLKTLKI